MRRLIVAAVAALTPMSAHADCHLSTGLTVNQFVPDLIHALDVDGVAAPTFVGLQAGTIVVVIPPNNIVGLQLIESNDMLNEVDVAAISNTLSDNDKTTFVAATAATAAVLSGTSQTEIKQQVDKGLQGISMPGNFRLQWGETAASISRIDRGLGARIGKRHCD